LKPEQEYKKLLTARVATILVFIYALFSKKKNFDERKKHR
jgi:hypothetical protein